MKSYRFIVKYVYICDEGTYDAMSENQDIHHFTLLFNRHRDRFTDFAATYVGSRAVAEDMVMDAFLYYWERMSSLDNKTNIPAYILTTVKHRCLNHLRSKAIHARAREGIISHNEQVIKLRISTLEAMDPDEIFSEKVQLAIRTAINSLPARTREIYLESRLNNKTYKEIAEKYATSVKSVEFEISKATKSLRAKLKDSSLYLSLMVLIELGLLKL